MERLINRSTLLTFIRDVDGIGLVGLGVKPGEELLNPVLIGFRFLLRYRDIDRYIAYTNIEEGEERERKKKRCIDRKIEREKKRGS